MGNLKKLYNSGHQFGEDFKAIAARDWEAKLNLVEIVECGAKLKPELCQRFDDAMKKLHDATEIRTFLNGFCAGYDGGIMYRRVASHDW